MSQPAPQEIEAKFLIGDPAQIVPLRTAPELAPAYPLEDIGVVEMADEYLDTPDLRLLRQGYGLRIRSLADRQLVTLKVPSHRRYQRSGGHDCGHRYGKHLSAHGN